MVVHFINASKTQQALKLIYNKNIFFYYLVSFLG